MWSRTLPKLPITIEEKQWLDDTFLFFKERLGNEVLLKQPIVLPTKDFFSWEFKGVEKDAEYVLKRVAEIMRIDLTSVDLTFYEEPSTVELIEGLVIQSSEQQHTAGRFIEYDDGGVEIMIEIKQLKDPISLIATVAHELTHLKLMKEGTLQQNDELLIEIAVLIFGFGIFNANTSVIKMNSWSGLSHTGWRLTGGDGYLHHRLHAFAMALHAYYRGHRKAPQWTKYVDKEISTYIKRSLGYILANPTGFRFIT